LRYVGFIMLGAAAVSSLFLTLVSSPPVMAAMPSYLPLAAGNRWELTSRARKQPMVFEVISGSEDEFLVRWDNPFVKNVVYGFRPSGNRVLLSSLDLGRGATRLPDDTVYFDFEGAGPRTWTNLLGEFTVFEGLEKIETPSGVYMDCIHIRYRTKEKSNTEYFLAPGIGFVQVGTGPAAYKLSSFRRSSDNSAPPRLGTGRK
jgi:hypothetical protein